MLRKKVNLLCYKKNNLPSSIFLLPGFLGRCLYKYSGIKYNKVVVSSLFMCFISLSLFSVTKKIGPIHVRKKSNKKSSKKK